MPETTDIISYAGEINNHGYTLICEALKTRKSPSALLVLATPGGDPHAGFRIARALQHAYGTFNALVPRYCKSAGTLILIGASTLYLDDMSELGPLDVQVKKGDEIVGRNSGLDIFQSVNYLQTQSMTAFLQYLEQLTDAGLSTRVASDIACRLTSGLFEPIAAQIDPIKLAEMQRATEIAFTYGIRLNEKSGNMRHTGMGQLVTGYPSHGFVIDRKEARTIFTDVRRPEGMMAMISEALRAEMAKHTNATTPAVGLLAVNLEQESKPNEDTPNATHGADGTAPGQPANDGNSPAAGPAAPTAEQLQQFAASTAAKPANRKPRAAKPARARTLNHPTD